jgi:hypothetical protein
MTTVGLTLTLVIQAVMGNRPWVSAPCAPSRECSIYVAHRMKTATPFRRYSG